MSHETILEALREATTRLLVPIQTTKVIDEAAFRAVHAEGLKAVLAYKGTPEVPKALLAELLATYSILRREAPYFGERRKALEEMADQIEKFFCMILMDEVPEDRVPGVPRVM